MARPRKSYEVIKGEGKSHRTKAELEERRLSEAANMSGLSLKERKEVSDNKIAHKEFLRIEKILDKIKKKDEIYSSVINRYCQIYAECIDFEKKKEMYSQRLEHLEEIYDNMEDKDQYIAFSDYLKSMAKIQGTIISIDKQIQTKRKMMFEIEKENIMTIASSLRNLPKKEQEEEEPLMNILRRRE